MTFVLPERVLQKIRNTAITAMPTTIYAYLVTISYNVYGEQVTQSGLDFTASGLIAMIEGDDDPLLKALRDDGLLKQKTARLLLPYATPITERHVIVPSGETDAWDVVYTNKEQSDSYKAYAKAIITKEVIYHKPIRRHGNE